MKRLTTLFLLFSLLCSSQEQIDSLRSVWGNTSYPDSGRFEAIHYLLSRYYPSAYPDSVQLVGERLLKEARKSGNEIYEHRALGLLGIDRYRQGDFSGANKCFRESLELNRERNNPKGIANDLSNLGVVQMALLKYPQAIVYYEEALGHLKNLEDRTGVARTLGNIGIAYGGMKKYGAAIISHKGCLMYSQEENDVAGVANTLNNIGAVYLDSGAYDTALVYFDRSLAISETENFPESSVTSTYNIGNIFLEQGKLKLAEEAGEKALELSREIGVLVRVKDALWLLYHVYKAQGDDTKALATYEDYRFHLDSMITMRNQKALIQEQIQNDFDRQEAVARQKNKDFLVRQQLMAAAQSRYQNMVVGFVIAGLLVVLLFSAFLFRRFKITKQQKSVIEEKNSEITDSITYAKRIQQAILPPSKLLHEALPNSFVLYLPKDIVAGDFYWLEPQGENVLFAAADCTGHGVPGAMVSVVCHNALNRSTREYGLKDPAKILDKTRELVLDTFKRSDEEVKDGMDIALCNFNSKTRQLLFAGANNELVIVRKGTTLLENVEQIKADKQPIGLFGKPAPFTSNQIQLNEGDMFYVFSDGYPDQFGGAKGKKFMYKRFRRLLMENSAKPIVEQHEILSERFNSWRGELSQLDDICVIGVRA